MLLKTNVIDVITVQRIADVLLINKPTNPAPHTIFTQKKKACVSESVSMPNTTDQLIQPTCSCLLLLCWTHLRSVYSGSLQPQTPGLIMNSSSVCRCPVLLCRQLLILWLLWPCFCLLDLVVLPLPCWTLHLSLVLDTDTDFALCPQPWSPHCLCVSDPRLPSEHAFVHQSGFAIGQVIQKKTSWKFPVRILRCTCSEAEQQIHLLGHNPEPQARLGDGAQKA